MVRILSRPIALVFAVALVGGASWALHNDLEAFFGPRILCMCILPPRDDTAGWQQLAAGSFTLMAPAEAALHQASATSGVIIDRRFTLAYNLDDRVDDASFAKTGQDYHEEDVGVGGRPGVIRSATFPDRKEPYFLQLVVPRAIQTKGGRWLTLEIHGWMRSYERWQLAKKVVRTIDFLPAFDKQVTPTRPHVDPPTIVIDYPSAKETL